MDISSHYYLDDEENVHHLKNLVQFEQKHLLTAPAAATRYVRLANRPEGNAGGWEGAGEPPKATNPPKAEPHDETPPRAAEARTQLLIRTLQGRTLVSHALPDSTGAQLHREVSRQLKLPVGCFYLTHQGRRVRPHTQIRNQAIAADSTIMVNARLRGGTAGRQPRDAIVRLTIANFFDGLRMSSSELCGKR